MTDKTAKVSHLFLELPAFAQTIVVVCLGALVLLCSLYVNQFGWQLSDSRDHWGQFGDFIGGVLNPIVAIGALIGIWYSVALQRKELAETRKALQDQVRLSSITVADQMLQTYFQAINHCSQTITHKSTNSSTKLTTTYYSDEAIEDDLDTFRSHDAWHVSKPNLPKDFAQYVDIALQNWLPLMNAIKQTIVYINLTFDEQSRVTRFELMRFHLSLSKLSALCYFIKLNDDRELHSSTKKANLLKNFPEGEWKDWFYSATFSEQ